MKFKFIQLTTALALGSFSATAADSNQIRDINQILDENLKQEINHQDTLTQLPAAPTATNNAVEKTLENDLADAFQKKDLNFLMQHFNLQSFKKVASQSTPNLDTTIQDINDMITKRNESMESLKAFESYIVPKNEYVHLHIDYDEQKEYLNNLLECAKSLKEVDNNQPFLVNCLEIKEKSNGALQNDKSELFFKEDYSGMSFISTGAQNVKLSRQLLNLLRDFHETQNGDYLTANKAIDALLTRLKTFQEQKQTQSVPRKASKKAKHQKMLDNLQNVVLNLTQERQNYFLVLQALDDLVVQNVIDRNQSLLDQYPKAAKGWRCNIL